MMYLPSALVLTAAVTLVTAADLDKIWVLLEGVALVSSRQRCISLRRARPTISQSTICCFRADCPFLLYINNRRPGKVFGLPASAYFLHIIALANYLVRF